jgi:cobalt-zinc-cadmium efflux system outer membrane protein
VKTHVSLSLSCAALVFLSAGVNWAQPQSEPRPEVAPPVEQLVAEALGQAPSLAALRARLAAAREMVSPAGALPDPTAELVLQDIGFPKWTVGSQEMSMIGPELRQDLLYPGKRQARREAAGAEATVRERELEQLQREVAVQVRTAYARIYTLDRERRALGAARELLDLLTATAAARYAAGEAEQEAVVKAQLQVSRVAERLDDVTAERQGLVASLNRLLDRPGDASLGEVEALPAVGQVNYPWQELAEANGPAVRVKEAEVQLAERRLASVRLELRPNLMAGAGVGLRGGLDPAVTLRFGVEWPLWSKEKQKPEIRAADQELVAASEELRDVRAAVRAEAARLSAELRRADAQIVRYREAIVPQTSATVDAARAAYLAGRGDFTTVIVDFKEWLDARAQMAGREAERFIAWSELQSIATSPTEN